MQGLGAGGCLACMILLLLGSSAYDCGLCTFWPWTWEARAFCYLMTNYMTNTEEIIYQGNWHRSLLYRNALSLSGHRSRRFSCREEVKRFWMYWRRWACAGGMLGNDEASETGAHQTGVLHILLSLCISSPSWILVLMFLVTMFTCWNQSGCSQPSLHSELTWLRRGMSIMHASTLTL